MDTLTFESLDKTLQEFQKKFPPQPPVEIAYWPGIAHGRWADRFLKFVRFNESQPLGVLYKMVESLAIPDGFLVFRTPAGTALPPCNHGGLTPEQKLSPYHFGGLCMATLAIVNLMDDSTWEQMEAGLGTGITVDRNSGRG